MATPEKIELIEKKDLERHPIFLEGGDDNALAEALGNDRLIIFYGAGVSMLGGCESWLGLAKGVVGAAPPEIYSELEKDALIAIAEQDARKAISICYHRFKRERALETHYYPAIKEAVTPLPEKEAAFKHVHQQLFDLGAIAYVTTNIDMGFERILGPARDGKRIISLANEESDSIISEIRNGNIFYLHGDLGALQQTIFTVDNYIDFYSRPVTQMFLQQIFRGDYCVLFIGYSLSEHEILQNIFLATRKKADSETAAFKHFILTPLYSRDLAKFNHERDYWKIFSVRAIPYFIDHEGFGRLHHVLDKLKNLKAKRAKPRLAVLDEVDRL